MLPLQDGTALYPLRKVPGNMLPFFQNTLSVHIHHTVFEADIQLRDYSEPHKSGLAVPRKISNTPEVLQQACPRLIHVCRYQRIVYH